MNKIVCLTFLLFICGMSTAQLENLFKTKFVKIDNDEFNGVVKTVMRDSKIKGPGIDLSSAKQSFGYAFLSARKTTVNGRATALQLRYYYYARRATEEYASFFTSGESLVFLIDGQRLALTPCDRKSVKYNTQYVDYFDRSEEAFFNLTQDEFNKIATAKEVKYQVSNQKDKFGGEFDKNVQADFKRFYDEYVANDSTVKYLKPNKISVGTTVASGSPSTVVSAQLKNGPYEEKHPNGSIKITGTYKDNKRIGKWKTYYSVGGIETEINYNDNGERDGTETFYKHNGDVSHKSEYKNGKLNGKVFTYTSGTVSSETSYLNDQKNGKYISYDTSGQKKEEGNYTNGLKDGEWKVYKSGKLFETKVFKNGIPSN